MDAREKGTFLLKAHGHKPQGKFVLPLGGLKSSYCKPANNIKHNNLGELDNGG